MKDWGTAVSLACTAVAIGIAICAAEYLDPYGTPQTAPAGGQAAIPGKVGTVLSTQPDGQVRWSISIPSPVVGQTASADNGQIYVYLGPPDYWVLLNQGCVKWAIRSEAVYVDWDCVDEPDPDPASHATERSLLDALRDHPVRPMAEMPK